MGRPERIALCTEIEAHRKRPMIAYFTSKRPGSPPSSMASDAIPAIIEQLDALPAGTELDFMIGSLGGDPMMAWRIISLIRARGYRVSSLIPQSAWSAATLFAIGTEQIMMHPNANLGPIDMQITTYGDNGPTREFSTEELTAFLNFIREKLKITEQEHVRILFENICKEVGSLGIGFIARSSNLAADLSRRLLGLHIKEEQRINFIVSSFEKFQDHAYPISRDEAKEMGLPIGEPDKTLEDLIWKLWLDVELEFKERIPFSAMSEILSSQEGKKLLSGVPMLALPANMQGTPSYQTTLQDAVSMAKETIEPVDFEVKNAMVESARICHVSETKGKILAWRTPDLSISWNALPFSRVWNKV
ncbi:MAG TPA: hypothetical protein VGM73_13285 [Candidatus Didemnitutus sp.]|jgi:hypothetical protein